jgi:hypothetical protein
MPTPQPFPIRSQPGIKRDSTVFEGDNYVDGLWTRFTPRALPKKIAGYQSVTSHLPEIVRGVDSFTVDLANYLHLGSASFVTQVIVNSNGSLGGSSDRTPVGFVSNPNNLWQIGAMRNAITGNTSVIAHAGQNLSDIADSTNSAIYYGNVTDNTPLVASTTDPISGGFIVLAPYLITFGNGGFVEASPVNDPTTPGVSGYVTAQKIVAGLPIRNTGGPGGLLWSLDSLIGMTFDSSITTGLPFDFNTISDEISILSSQSIVEFDGLYYWAAVDRFSVYNGVVRELPNSLNIDFFFDNVNFAQRQKVFVMKIPRWGEIWWCAPLFGATECNWAIIYNTRLQTWYDTPLPDGGRSAGLYAKVYQRPFMCDVALNSLTNGYTLWQHETGLDKVLGTQTTPVTAYYQTHEFSPISAPQPKDAEFRVGIIEPDFVQSGDLSLTISSRNNARDTPVFSAPITFPAVPTGPQDEVTMMKVNGRLLSFKFESNTIGGDFYAGNVIGHIETTGGRYAS